MPQYKGEIIDLDTVLEILVIKLNLTRPPPAPHSKIFHSKHQLHSIVLYTFIFLFFLLPQNTFLVPRMPLARINASKHINCRRPDGPSNEKNHQVSAHLATGGNDSA